MAKNKSIFQNLFSTQDPISEYRHKQDVFVDSMGHLSDGRAVKDYSTSSRQSDGRRLERERKK